MRGQVKIIQKKIIAKKRRRIFLLSLYSVFSLGIIFSVLSFISHMKSMRVDAFEIVGNSRLSTVEVENIVREKIAGNFMGSFSRSNAFLYPQDEIIDSLKAVPAVSDVEIERVGTKALRITLAERKEAALWCAGKAFESFDCYSLDDDGYVFASGRDESGSTTPIVFRGVLEPEFLGKHFLDKEDFKNLQFFIDQLGGLSVGPVEVAISDSNYMTVFLKDGGKFIIDRSDDLSKVLGNIAAIISDKSVAPSFSQFLNQLDYIKLDSGNKVVYKVKARPEGFAPVE